MSSHPLELILPRALAGFDVLAASVLARHLYPSAQLVAPPRLTPGARAFFALHKDLLAALDPAAAEVGRARRLVLVGLRHRAEIAGFPGLEDRVGGPDLDLHVIDHRPASPHDVPATLEIVEPVAALTTLVVEAIAHQVQDVTPEEATLGALGIHERTRSLTAAATTGRDAAALGWLLDRGASQRVVNRYLKPAFRVAQRALLSKLLRNVERTTTRGAEVGLAEVALERPVERLGEVLEELLRLEGLDAVFTLHPIGTDLLVAGASRTAQVHVGRALGALGVPQPSGSAATCVVPGENAAEARARLLEAIRSQPSPTLRVADAMSSPVRMVGPSATMRALAESLATWRHHGVPVVEGGAVVGVVSRRDVEKARREGALDRPVRERMSRNVQTIEPDATLEQAHEAMTSADVGRLPVVRDGRLVGILSRSDVLRRLYARRA